jgi:tRNA dimethylallyltransferase
VAEALGGHVLSVDSMQVYRGMDIGTAKPATEVRAAVPHHLIDLADPEENFTVAAFQDAGVAVLDDLATSGVPAVIAGGSGLHFRALVDPLHFPPTDDSLRAELEATSSADLVARLLEADPAAAAHVDLANPRRVLRAVEIHTLTGETPSSRAADPDAVAVRRYRPREEFVAVGLDPGDLLAARVERRFDRMLAAGLLDEVAGLEDRLGPTAAQAVGYKELLPVVRGLASLEAARADAVRATLALAKRQRTFFGRDPRIRWLGWSDDPERRRRAAFAALEEAGTWSS